MQNSRRYGIRVGLTAAFLSAGLSLWRIMQIEEIPPVLSEGLVFVIISFALCGYGAGVLSWRWGCSKNKSWWRMILVAFLASLLLFSFVSIPLGIIGAVFSSHNFEAFLSILPLQIFIAFSFGLQLMLFTVPLFLCLAWGCGSRRRKN